MAQRLDNLKFNGDKDNMRTFFDMRSEREKKSRHPSSNKIHMKINVILPTVNIAHPAMIRRYYSAARKKVPGCRYRFTHTANVSGRSCVKKKLIVGKEESTYACIPERINLKVVVFEHQDRF